ncbi:hypothetical protein ALC60_08186 [Trachymyrmex zeteki]|uniref:Uncharacterized protein n=1 Tax=Mycetomoellerius zeteki TaxID=64791 RepID=A0A151WXQ0_9HYME|nr:hypothetical protein ALC60_08186 [Trachymyrmex zeteki]
MKTATTATATMTTMTMMTTAAAAVFDGGFLFLSLFRRNLSLSLFLLGPGRRLTPPPPPLPPPPPPRCHLLDSSACPDSRDSTGLRQAAIRPSPPPLPRRTCADRLSLLSTYPRLVLSSGTSHPACLDPPPSTVVLTVRQTMNPRGAPTPAGGPIARLAGVRDVPCEEAKRIAHDVYSHNQGRRHEEREKVGINYRDRAIREIIQGAYYIRFCFSSWYH